VRLFNCINIIVKTNPKDSTTEVGLRPLFQLAHAPQKPPQYPSRGRHIPIFHSPLSSRTGPSTAGLQIAAPPAYSSAVKHTWLLRHTTLKFTVTTTIHQSKLYLSCFDRTFDGCPPEAATPACTPVTIGRPLQLKVSLFLPAPFEQDWTSDGCPQNCGTPRVFTANKTTRALLRNITTANASPRPIFFFWKKGEPCYVNGRPAPCYLFARKFSQDSMEGLLTLLPIQEGREG
jgi:hypothetical protein